MKLNCESLGSAPFQWWWFCCCCWWWFMCDFRFGIWWFWSKFKIEIGNKTTQSFLLSFSIGISKIRISSLELCRVIMTFGTFSNNHFLDSQEKHQSNWSQIHWSDRIESDRNLRFQRQIFGCKRLYAHQLNRMVYRALMSSFNCSFDVNVLLRFSLMPYHLSLAAICVCAFDHSQFITSRETINGT